MDLDTLKEFNECKRQLSKWYGNFVNTPYETEAYGLVRLFSDFLDKLVDSETEEEAQMYMENYKAMQKDLRALADKLKEKK